MISHSQVKIIGYRYFGLRDMLPSMSVQEYIVRSDSANISCIEEKHTSLRYRLIRRRWN